MCGIVGFWSDEQPSRELVRKMAESISTRGPDDCGDWIDLRAGLALGHRRLAIVDLSPSGHQPMMSPCERFVLVFNGEIYNCLEIKVELESVTDTIDWKGHSDTEILLHALLNWGVEDTLQKLNGMFAFAFWDSLNDTLILARDRVGEKPLYYGYIENTFLFGSELKALRTHPKCNPKVNRDALALYMRHNYIGAPHSIYVGIQKLPPAHFAVIRDKGRSIGEPRCYWNLASIACQTERYSELSHNERIDNLDVLLRDSVKLRMMADVPLGAFLSGGYDSSTVVALMQSLSSRPVKTFSIGFSESSHNEAAYAKEVAKHLGTEHHELYVEPRQALDIIPKLARMFDEPFSDSSQIPTYLVSELARGHVTVALSGDGGDELFCGYQRYSLASRIWNKVSRVPTVVRPIVSWGVEHFPLALAQSLEQVPFINRKIPHLSDRLPKLARLLNRKSFELFYLDLVSHAKDPEKLVLGSSVPQTVFNSLVTNDNRFSLNDRMMLLDSLTYLPGDILTKVDRSSMAVSLEARVPMLDHRLIEFAWSIPQSMKVRNGASKWLLRQVLYKYVPKHLVDRPKQGFGVPIEHWLRGPLRDWAEMLLEERKLRQQGYLDPAPIRRMWAEHLSGKRRWHYYLWDVLMFQAWLEEWKV